MFDKNIEIHHFHNLNDAGHFAHLAEEKYQCLVKIFKKRKNKKVYYLVKVYKNKHINIDDLYKLDFDHNDNVYFDDVIKSIYTEDSTGEDVDPLNPEQEEYLRKIISEKKDS